MIFEPYKACKLFLIVPNNIQNLTCLIWFKKINFTPQKFIKQVGNRNQFLS